jgi:hypothetical protein
VIVPDVENCFIKVRFDDDHEEECGRPREKVTDLCCKEHWARVPKPLRVALINAEKQTNVLKERKQLNSRNLKKCELDTIIAATAIVEYLKAQKIQLPPAPKLIKTAGGIEAKVGPLVKVDAGPRVVAQSKLIIPGR